MGSTNNGTNSAARVVCTTELKALNKMKPGLSGRTSHTHGTVLVAIVSFEPLKEAFGEYCRMLLCTEVFIKNSFYWKFPACVVYLGRVLLLVHSTCESLTESIQCRCPLILQSCSLLLVDSCELCRMRPRECDTKNLLCIFLSKERHDRRRRQRRRG